MKRKSLEPGILTALTWTLVLQLAMLVNSQVLPSLAHNLQGSMPFYQFLPALLLSVILLGLLIPPLRRRVTPGWLLVILFTASAAVLSTRYIGVPGGAGGQGFSLARSFFVWDQVIFLVIPMALIAWQFSLAEVISFAVFTAVFDLLVELAAFSAFPAFAGPGGPLEPLRGTLLIRISGSSTEIAVPFLFLSSVSSFIRSIILVILGVLELRIMNLQRQQRAELVEANEKLTHYALTIEQLTVSRERNRMARELHDTLAHTLSSVAVELEAVKALVKSKPAEALKLVDQSLGITRNGLNETRKALQDLRALPIDDLGLTLALKTQVESVSERVGIPIQVRIGGGMDKLPGEVSYCIYRVAQEGLENIARHADAAKASLRLARVEGNLRLSIQDDGQGFDPKAVDSNEKFGLKGMSERAEMLGGHLIVESKPGKGTTIHLVLPGKP